MARLDGDLKGTGSIPIDVDAQVTVLQLTVPPQLVSYCHATANVEDVGGRPLEGRKC